MAYCVKADIIEAYPSADLTSLTDDEGDGSQVDARITAIIVRSDALIDSYCRPQHTVPFTVAPQTIQDASIVISYYLLNQRRRSHKVDEGLQKKYDDTIKWLVKVSERKVLIDDADSFANTGGIFASSKASGDKIYTSSYMEKYTTNE